MLLAGAAPAFAQDANAGKGPCTREVPALSRREGEARERPRALVRKQRGRHEGPVQDPVDRDKTPSDSGALFAN